MLEFIKKLKNKVLNNEEITFEEAVTLINIDIENSEEMEALCESADEVRKKKCGNSFDLCTIINAKSGKCSENCKYCAQSAHFKTGAEVYPLVSKEFALDEAKKVESEGAHRFSLVTSGRGIEKNSKEITELENIYNYLRENTNLSFCASHGICDEEVLRKIHEAGVTTYHHNLESCKEYYGNVCTSHTYEDRIRTIKSAQKVGLKVCSGGIFGLGETPVQRVKMAFELKELNVFSVPLNVLMPIKGTPFENNESVHPKELLKTMAVYRFILPEAYIRYAGGRAKLGDLQEKGIRSGVNSALTGNFLTTTGSTIESDKKMIKGAGYEIK